MGAFERLYHIVIAVTALGTLVAIVFGTLFLLLDGLADSLWNFDLFALLGHAWQASLLFLAETLEGLPAVMDRLWDDLRALLDGAESAKPDQPTD